MAKMDAGLVRGSTPVILEINTKFLGGKYESIIIEVDNKRNS